MEQPLFPSKSNFCLIQLTSNLFYFRKHLLTSLIDHSELWIKHASTTQIFILYVRLINRTVKLENHMFNFLDFSIDFKFVSIGDK